MAAIVKSIWLLSVVVIATGAPAKSDDEHTTTKKVDLRMPGVQPKAVSF